jgi:sulfoxide reductase catalytic subunit YedY
VPEDQLWTAKKDSVSLPGQVGLPGLRHAIGLARWWHLGMDMIWLLNGLVFYVLCFATPHWHRLIPTTWSVFPNALSVLIQYLSLNWPNESGWVAYNALQQLAYFVTVFIAAPLALITGLGMSPALSTRIKFVSRRLSIRVARSLHFLIMVWFVIFIVFHTALVVTTGALRNFNHIYLGRNDQGWAGFWVFAASMIIVIVAWVWATPFTLRRPRVVQRMGQALVGPIQHLFEHVDAIPGEYGEKDISPYFWHNGHFPDTDVFATGDGRRGAAVNFTTGTLPAPATIAALNLQRLLGCRMRFGRIENTSGSPTQRRAGRIAATRWRASSHPLD